MKTYLLPLLFLGCCATTFAQDITGDWFGKLSVQGSELSIVFHIEEVDGSLKASLDSPDQGATGIPTDETTFDGGQLRISAAALGLVYTAELGEDGQLKGTFNQGGMSLPLDMVKENRTERLRPQDPTDFPYLQEEVRIANAEAPGVTLAGTLTMPDGERPKAVAILVSGSGPQNRDEEIALFNHRPFLVLSDHLTRQGVAVLRYDDRGVAESTGDFASATSADFASDVRAIVNYVRTRRELKEIPLGIIGHSEGGMIAPLVAAERGFVDYIVMLAGPGTAIDELLIAQSTLLAEAEGTPPAEVQNNELLMRELYQYLKDNERKEVEEIRPGVTELIRTGLDRFSEETLSEFGDLDDYAATLTATVVSPWFRYFISYDPARYIRKVTCPILALNGELDLQVPAEDNINAIKDAVKSSGNPNATAEILPGLNHMFQQAETGAVSEYAEIEETFNAEALQRISDWILGL
ncbi:MAG: alpha/beta fold hydrolase [Bacteroidota bacterium]